LEDEMMGDLDTAGPIAAQLGVWGMVVLSIRNSLE